MDRDAFDLQHIKRVGQSFYISTYFILNLSSGICHIFVFRHCEWQSFEMCFSRSTFFAMKIMHNATFNFKLVTYCLLDFYLLAFWDGEL